MRSAEKMPGRIPAGTPVVTPDGDGTTRRVVLRKNTNGGPGCRAYLVQLEDGRWRRYSRSSLKPRTR